MQENVIAIPNAPHWLNHSHVVVKEDLLAEDQEWIANQSTQIINAGTQEPRIEAKFGSTNLLLVRRMVIEGVVAVKRSGDRTKTVSLPADAHKLLASDLDYIARQIQVMNTPMTEGEQQDFLHAANGHFETSLTTVK